MQYQPSQIPIAAKPVVPQQTQAINLSTALNHHHQPQSQQHQSLGAAAITLPAAQGVPMGAAALNQPAVGATTMTLPTGQLVIQGGATTLQVKIEGLKLIYYCLPTRLREGNVFSGVCHSVRGCPMCPSPMTSPYRDSSGPSHPPPRHPLRHGTSLCRDPLPRHGT